MLPRHLLPQIPKDEMDKFRKYANDNGVSSKLVVKSVNALVPIQRDYNKDKVKKFMKSDDSDMPLVIANDNRIMDGHHRFLAKWVKNKETRVECLQFNCSITQLVELGHLFDESEVRTVKEIVM